MSNLRVDRFNELFRREYGDVFRFLARRADAQVASDVAQETFTTAWRRLDEVPIDASEARAWLFRTARNHLLNTQRSGNRQHALAIKIGENATEYVTGPESGVIAHRDLSLAWRTLNPAEQEVLALIGWEELSVTEAAKVLGVSTVTVRSRLRRARATLRTALDSPPTENEAHFVPARAAPLAQQPGPITTLVGAQP